MIKKVTISDIFAREIFDSRGNPTIEVEVLAGENYIGKASVPSGASKGKSEAVELRDGGKRLGGKGVLKAIDHVNQKIAPHLIGCNVLNQREIDQLLLKLDGTRQKSDLGANAILGVSMACARAGACALGIPLYEHLGGCHFKSFPIPMMNVINGGVHADNKLDIQEFMIVPIRGNCFRERMELGTEIYHALREKLKESKMQTTVGDEGGFAPDFPDAAQALKVLCETISECGYEPGKDVALALDVASGELLDETFQKYVFSGEGKMHGHQVVRSPEEMIDYLEDLTMKYPVISVEDGLCEEDWEGWELLTTRMGQEVMLVGDDLFVTNKERLQEGIDKSVGNAILIKMNQIGTLTETMETIELAKRNGYKIIISHRSGETEDPFIADLAVAVGADYIKSGAPCRMERVCKYNRLLEIEEKHLD